MDVTFREVAEEYLELPSLSRKAQTLNSSARDGPAEWGEIPIRDIDDRMVSGFPGQKFQCEKQQGIMRKISGATYNNYVTYYRAVMNYARDELRGLISLISSVYENVRTTFLEPEQFDRMRKLLDPLRDDLAVFAPHAS